MNLASPIYGTAFLDLKPDMDRFGREVESQLGKSTGGLSGAGKKVGLAVGGAAVAGVGAAFAGGIKGALDFAGFERSMNEVFTLLPGISGQAMDEMSAQVKGFSREFAVLPEQVVPALYQSLSAGVPPDNVFEFLETAQKAALGGVTDLETAVDGISSVVNAYGSDVLDAAEASDLMFTAVRLGKTDFSQLSASLFQVIPTASALGVEFGDVTAALATMTAQGTPTSVATTQLRQLFVELSKAGGAASGAFQEMAGKTFQEFIAEGGNVADALVIMQDAASESGVQLQDMFGSVEAGAAALSLAGGDAFTDNLAAMGDAAGATDAAFEQMDQGLSRSWERIKTTFSVAFVDIGTRLAPFVQTFADAFAEKLPAIIDKGFELFDGLLGVVDRLAPIFSGIAETVGHLFDVFREGEGFADGIIGVFSSLGQSLGDSGFFEGILEMVQNAFASVVDWLSSGGFETIISALLEGRSALLDVAVKLFTGLLDALITVLPMVAGFITDTLLPQIVRVISTEVPMFLRAGLQLFRGLVDALVIIIPELIATFVEVIPELLSTILGMAPDLLNAAAGAFFALVDGLLEILPDLLDTIVSDLLPAVIETILTMAPGLLVAAVEVFFALVNGLLDVLPQLLVTVTAVVLPKLITTLVGMVPQLLSTALAVFAALITGLVRTIPKLIGTIVTELIPAVVRAVGGLIGAFIKLGADMIGGLLSGFGNIVTKVYNTIRDGITGAIRKVKDFFGVKSPSKFFRDQLGVPLGEGILLGVEESLLKLSDLMVDELRDAQRQAVDALEPIDLGLADTVALDRIRARANTLADPSLVSGGFSVGDITVYGTAGQPTEESIRSTLLSVALNPYMRRVSGGSSI